MKDRLLHILIFLITTGLFQLNGVSQDTLSGTVKDGYSLEPLSGAHIILPGIQKGTSTDARGDFRISGDFTDPPGLLISFIGYRDTLIQPGRKNFQNMLVLLERDSVEMASVVITASRTRQVTSDVPQRIDVIEAGAIQGYPATNIDNLLRTIPGINVNRSWGIFSRNASVTMRGMPGSSRSLILLDGIPLNKTAGGSVNWHLLAPEEIDRIEVVKGPGSTIYGNNAMGGVINLITRQPQNKIEGTAGLGYGTFNTFKARVNMNGNNVSDSKGFFWKLGGFYRQGDGYILEPGNTRDSINADAYLYEGNANGMVGYRFSGSSKIEMDYRFYKDKRGAGLQVYEKDGSYESLSNNNIRVSWEGAAGKMKLNVVSFYLSESYFRQSENLNASAEYKLVDTKTEKNDYGLWLTLSRPVGSKHLIISGIDLKQGDLDNHEIYRTSTDDISTHGNLLFTALFIQDEISLNEGKFNIVAGIRLDHAKFFNGKLEVKDPTSKTGFPGSLTEVFPGNSWIQISPKAALNYSIHPSLRTYATLSTGFMPPRLDDLAGSRKIRRGFKIANPELGPETILSAEWGLDWTTAEKLSIKPSLFYSGGNDFQYLVATGEFIDSGSEEPVPVFQRQNVSRVEVAGAELGLGYAFTERVLISAAYTRNYSRILDYESPGPIDLAGKHLNEVPPNIVNIGFSWRNRIVDLYIDYTFTDEQWFDEENTEIIESYSVVNVRLSRKVFSGFHATIDIQDLLDEQYIDRKGYLSPGRFIMVEIKYSFNNKR